jgi:rod shape-determining protein MreD
MADGRCVVFLICAGILVLQGSLFPLLWPLAYQPDPLLVLVISLSILLGEKRGSLVGLAAGLLQDISLGPPWGSLP